MTGKAKSCDHAAPGKDSDSSDKILTLSPDTKVGIENNSAIPTAGGTQLGARHWGESTVVPDWPMTETLTGECLLPTAYHALFPH